MAINRFEELVRSARVAADASLQLASEVEYIVDNSLPVNASRALRAHLRRVAIRLREMGKALAAELDDPAPDAEIVSLLTKGLRKAATLFVSGVLFASGTAITGGLEDLGADAKDTLLEYVTQIETAADDVDEATSVASLAQTARSEPTGLPALLAALESSDARVLAAQMPFLFEIEQLAREALVETLQDEFSDSWLTEAQAILQSPADGRLGTPSSWGLGEVVRILRDLGERELLPEDYLGLPDGGAVDLLGQATNLRNEFAHGGILRDGWLDEFRDRDGASLIREVWQLYERLRNDRRS